MERNKVKYKIALVVKDKDELLEHKGHKDNQMKKEDLKKIYEDRLLYDENDIKLHYKKFQKDLNKHSFSNTDDMIDWINETYLGCPRIHRQLRLHQALALAKFSSNHKKGYRKHILSHKPRSGKTLTMLSIAKELLDQGCNRILIATPVPDTINQFIKEIERYIEFVGINYKRQDEFLEIDESFHGIIFCSTQYFKTGNTAAKRSQLKKLQCDGSYFDEAHFSTSTIKTYIEMIHSCDNESMIQIFASGTSRKTEEFYDIPSCCIYRWDPGDEIFMKAKSFSNLTDTHGPIFDQLLESGEYDSDYSSCPYQVLMRDGLCQDFIRDMDTYNKENKSDKGYTSASMLALSQKKRSNKGSSKFKNQFQLSTNSKGNKMLKQFLESIISSDPQCTDDIMTQIEETQSEHSSRLSTIENPKLFLMFLPFGKKIGTIQGGQKTLIKYLKDNELWTDYHVCYSNSIDNSSESDESYIKRVEKFMIETRNMKKKGCILLLGSQGSLGISYPDCDVTISLDGGKNLDEAKQRYYRALMESEGKTIGINVDLNIQRCWLYQKDIIRSYRKKPNVPKDPVKLLDYLYKHKLYYFDPLDKRLRLEANRIDYFEESVCKMRQEIEVEGIVDGIVCKDDLRDMIKEVVFNPENINPDIQGLQPDCNPGGEEKVEVDLPEDCVKDNQGKAESPLEEESEDTIFGFKSNRTKELYGDLAVTASLLIIWDRKNPENAEISSVDLIHRLMKDECRYSIVKNRMNGRYGIQKNHINNIYEVFIKTMKQEHNQDIIDNIIDIYSDTSPQKLREAIAKNFTPSEEEKKKNAEIPTPCVLVDDMLNKIPVDYFQSVHKTLEPSCGKGNFVLGIFDRFFKGFSHIDDMIERCRVIIEECIFFADIDEMNVHITKNLLMFHAIASISEDDSSWGDWDKVTNILEFKYNMNVGDALQLDQSSIWGIDGFDSVIGNPPYNKGKKSNFYVEFINEAHKKWLCKNGYLLFVTPNRFLIPKHKANKSIQMYQVDYICHTVDDFNVSTDIGYFLARKTDAIDNTKVNTTFKDGNISQINLDIPTPTANNDLRYKVISDKIIGYADKHAIFTKKELETGKEYRFIARRWTRYCRSKKKGGKHVFDISDEHGEDGRYLEKDNDTIDYVTWFITRSKLMRFITNNYASTVYVPPFIWSVIPKIKLPEDLNTYNNLSMDKKDRFIYSQFCLTEDEISLIDTIVD